MIHDTIKQRLRASLLLPPPAKSAPGLALGLAENMRSDGAWDDLPAPLAVPLGAGRPPHLERVLSLAKAHRAAAGVLDDPLRRALDFWLSNDPRGTDWRQHQIAIPRIVGEIALLGDGILSPGAMDKVREILARSRWANWDTAAGWSDCVGLDLLGVAHNHLLRGCLENVPAFFESAFGRIFRELRPAGAGAGGIQADMTFRAPDGGPPGNALAFLRECAQFITVAHGTPWQAPPEAVKLFVGFLLGGQQWTIRQRVVDAEPPNDVFAEAFDLDGTALAIQQLAQMGNPLRRPELADLARRLQSRSESLFGHRYFWCARRAIHQRPGFYASLRLGASTVADGRTYFLRAGDEYQGLDLTPIGAVIPGTTARPAARDTLSEDVRDQTGGGSVGLSGGVSEGDYGLTVTALRRPGLSAKKAWFFFDESLVCLGTGLTAAGDDGPVHTTINHCRLRGPVKARWPNGDVRVLAIDQPHALPSPQAVEHDGITYFFPLPTTVLVSPSDPLGPGPAAIRLEIDHGQRPRGASWACIVLPTGNDPEATPRTLEEVSRLAVLANTPALQAVRHGELGLLAAAFWEPGTVPLPGGGRAAANRPCVLLCRESPDGGTRVSVASLTDQPATIHVEYGGRCVAFEMPGGAEAGRSTSRFL